jgi:4-hydroxybenzoate polyprenyltransferase
MIRLLSKIPAYLRLMRMHKPVGVLLLWLPTAWALWIANQGRPPLPLIIYFFCGTLLMRAAGCIINDMADRHIDIHVKRTHKRPLAAGEVGLFEALTLLGFLLLGALWIVLQLPKTCFYYAIVALLISILYPFCKRFFIAPQLVLGFAFSMGIPMAYAASYVPINLITILLFTLNFAWIVAYDTMYAMADKEDDLRLGVQSTAIWFSPHERLIIGILQIFFHLMWLYIAWIMQWGMLFYLCWSLAIGILFYQQILLSRNNSEAYLSAFSSSVMYGALMWLSLL